MNRLSVFQKISFRFFALAILSVALISIVLGSIKSFAESNEDLQNLHSNSIVSPSSIENTGSESTKTFPARWITVDENELNHIQKISENKNLRFDLEVVEKRGGLSVLVADEEQTLNLSRDMHEEFHKCAGFMAHESLDAARLSIERSLQADTSQQVVEYTINNQAVVNSLINETKESQIRETITRLSTDFINRRYNQPSGTASAEWIKNKWTDLAAGRDDITVEFFNHTYSTPNDFPQPSIILTVQGSTLPAEVVVLGAHQDSINRSVDSAPGADDDASGIAGLTETIRVMVVKNFRPKRTVKFMAYAAEEVGLIGSQAIAADFKQRGVNVVGVLQLDMTNYKSPNSAVDIVIITDRTNTPQNEFLRDLISTYLPLLAVGDSTCGYCSDHASWTNQGFAASFPFEGISNPTIHTISDTLAQSGGNANHAHKFTNLAVAYLGELAKGSLSLTTVASANISGRVMSGRRGISQARVSLNDAGGAIRTTLTNAFGFYKFTDVAVGETYSLDVRSKRYKFASQIVNVTKDLTDLDFYPY